MNRDSENLRTSRMRVPRMRGDEPSLNKELVAAGLRSPHARG